MPIRIVRVTKKVEKQEEVASQADGEKPIVSAQLSSESQGNRLGHPQIPLKALTASCRGVMNWINQFILSQVINSFP